jgi:carbonic anhydrase/acetyltransferase-like protein (isoleucine patch superfamily)
MDPYFWAADMKELQKLFDRIVMKVNINLRELGYDVGPVVRNMIPLPQLVKFYAFYGLTSHHPPNLQFRHASLAGSYFLGKCDVTNSILYKSDIRGDELKHKGDRYRYGTYEIPICRDEGIEIEDSFLVKTLVHCFSHDPETLENFYVQSTVSTHYANIHGSPVNGSFLGPFATVDLTTVNDCVVGTFAYVQAGEIGHLNIEPGTVWVRGPGSFNFLYRFPSAQLNDYIRYLPGQSPQGLIVDFIEDRKADFQRIFNVVEVAPSVSVPASTSLDRYAVIKPKTHIGDNVLVAQRAFLQNAWIGKGANAQENSAIINSRLAGFNVTAHGAKIIEADLGERVFVGFNSFLRGRPGSRLIIGKESIIMPHTIIDAEESLSIPAGSLVWGLVKNGADLAQNRIALKKLSTVTSKLTCGDLVFEGSGAAFVAGFRDRIDHILASNGAYYDGKKNRGHAQENRNIAFNTIQPYLEGDKEGLYPSIRIQP